MFSPFRKRDGILFVLTVFTVIFQHGVVAASRTLLPYNPGDQYGLFRFTIPLYYQNATLGPETFDWLVSLYGRSSVIRNNIRRAPSESHVCGNGGWCRLHCRQFEDIDWKSKNICGAYNCCQQKETTHSENHRSKSNP